MSEKATEFERKYFETLRRLGPSGRLKAACGLYEFARSFLAANLRAKHPDWTDDRLHEAVVERLRATH